MATRTIDLSTIPPLYSKKLLNHTFTYDNDRFLRKRLHSQFKRLKKLSDNQFSNWLKESSSSDVIKEIDKFLEKSSKQDNLFPNLPSKLIHVTSLTLGLHASDHDVLLESITHHVESNYNPTTVLRIKVDVVKKDLVELIQTNKNMMSLFVIVEQTDVMSINLLDHLIQLLHKLPLNGSGDREVRVLFCMSCNWNSITHLLPINSLDRIRVYQSIVNDTRATAKELPTKLLLNKESSIQIGPNLTNFIYYLFLEKDASFTNLKYLYQYSLFKHSMKFSSALNLPRKELLSLLKNDGTLIETLKQLRSVKSMQRLDVNWNNPNKVADFIIDSVEKVKNHFSFIWRELQSYFYLLQDETGRSFPSHLFDLYEELLKCEDLGQSMDSVDAVSKINALPKQRLLRRIDLVISNAESRSDSAKDDESISSLLIRFKEKLDNNPDCEKMLKVDLINDLRIQLRQLENPKTLPLFEVVYFNDFRLVRKRTLPHCRVEASKIFSDSTSYFGILYDILKESPEENRTIDLFNEFRQKFEESKESPLKSSIKSSQIITSARKVQHVLPRDEVDEGVLKAVFMDIVLCMEQQGLIKRDTRKSKAGILRRLVWL